MSPSPRLPYQRPRLVRLGDVGVLTQSAGASAMPDGGAAPNNMAKS